MAISDKYGKLSIPGVGDDEPVFVLRAQDKLAEASLEMYRALAHSHDAKVAASVPDLVLTFRNWKGVKKLPD